MNEFFCPNCGPCNLNIHGRCEHCHSDAVTVLHSQPPQPMTGIERHQEMLRELR